MGNQLRQERKAQPVAPVLPELEIPDAGVGAPAAGTAGSGDQTVVVNRVVFSGLDELGLSESAVQPAVAAMLGQAQSFAGLQAMADKVTALLRDRGLLLGRAILPPQKIKDGVLHIQVTAGRYDRADIRNTSRLRDGMAQRLIDATAPQGAVVRKAPLERVALLLNEIPGVQASVALKAGQQSGTSALDVTVQPGKRVGGYVGLDNKGDPTTGRSRVLAGVYANELLGVGDQLRVDGLDAYEKNNLFNGALDYSVLAGRSGTRAGVTYSHLNYRYRLSGLAFDGYSDNWGVYLSQPWIRSPQARLDVRFDAGQQFLTDKYPQGIADVIAQGKAQGRKRMTVGTVSVQGSVASTPGGVSAFALHATVGEMAYLNKAARAFGGDNVAYTAGGFERFNYMVSHDQQVWGPFSLYANLNGQMASHNLDASQKFLMGGPSAVRAYDIGDGPVDTGNVLTVEARSRLALPDWPLLGREPALTAAAFYDQGWGMQNKVDRNPLNRSRMAGKRNRFSLAGAGVYVSVADAGNYVLTATWAWRTGGADPVSGHRHGQRFWLAAIKTF